MRDFEPEFQIANRSIGYCHTPLVIAEIGINHGGSLERAIAIADSAMDAGAEVIKHQTHIIDDEMSHEAKLAIPGNADRSIYEIISECALNEADERKLMDHITGRGAIFISTPFSRAAAERLESMGVPAYKIGSGECNNTPLIEHIAGYGKPVILSTGMNDLDSIEQAVQIFDRHQTPYALLHCTNIYPTPPQLVRLGALSKLQKRFKNAVIGLSDHTINNYACLGAVALGASILERHFTDSKLHSGPDIACSMDGAELGELMHGSHILWQERGGHKVALAEEQQTMDFAFSTVVTLRPITRGEKFNRENIWVKRPGCGEIPASHYDDLQGKYSNSDLAEDTHLCWRDVTEEME